ncbi:ubiquitin 3 binding protein But2 C-terminal domain-containing protein [Hypoxylon cercidicola]|nr:ubiquitin 3 binding protein But2 C-terminal domain-containing protein [Hypoxylon cercidicola]
MTQSPTSSSTTEGTPGTTTTVVPGKPTTPTESSPMYPTSPPAETTPETTPATIPGTAPATTPATTPETPPAETSATGYPTSPAPVYPTMSMPEMSSSAAGYPTAPAPAAGGAHQGAGPEHPNGPEAEAKGPEAQPHKIPRRARATEPRSGACPGELTGQFASPRLVVPVDSANPDTAYGPSPFGEVEVSSTISTVFDFAIPASAAGKTCTLVFLFPARDDDDDDEDVASSNTTGSGAVEFSRLEGGGVDEKTTQSSLPDAAQSYRRLAVAPGHAYAVDSFACPGGRDVAVEMAAVPGTDTQLRFLQDADSDACPLGLYILTSATGGVEL